MTNQRCQPLGAVVWKANMDSEIDRNRKGKMIVLDWTPSHPQLHTLSIGSARVEQCVWTELCLCGASLPPGDNGRHQLLFLGLLYLLRYVLQTRIGLMSFPRDANLLPRQQCLSHLALGAGLTPGWVHSKFVGQWSPSAISCVNHHFLAGLKHLGKYRGAPCNSKKTRRHKNVNQYYKITRDTYTTEWYFLLLLMHGFIIIRSSCRKPCRVLRSGSLNR